MEIWNIVCAFGIPALLLAYVINKFKAVKAETDAIKSGVRALLRSQMIHEYNKWTDKGYVPIYARENFEDCFVQYTNLGGNGVMKDLHSKFLSLPTELKEEKDEH